MVVFEGYSVYVTLILVLATLLSSAIGNPGCHHEGDAHGGVGVPVASEYATSYSSRVDGPSKPVYVAKPVVVTKGVVTPIVAKAVVTPLLTKAVLVPVAVHSSHSFPLVASHAYPVVYASGHGYGHGHGYGDGHGHGYGDGHGHGYGDGHGHGYGDGHGLGHDHVKIFKHGYGH